MKKAINLLLVTVLLFSLLTACSNNGNNITDPTQPQTPDNSGSNTTDPTQPTNPGNNDDTSQIDIGNISNITDFSNGFAFVRLNNDSTVYCIDKTGKQIFTLENNVFDTSAKFNKEIAIMMTSIRNEYILCDQKGNTYKAEDFGASRIVLDKDIHRQAFLDGYIILERREESYTGTKIEMSVIDSDFNTLVPFSVELAETLNHDTFNGGYTAYYDGYLYDLALYGGRYGDSDTILDLRTGTLLSDRTQITVTTPLLEYWSKGTSGWLFDHLEWGDIYNALTGEVVARVSESDSESISSISFIGDIGLAKYYTDNGTWFNVITSDGTAKFQPIKAASDHIEFDGETILVVGKYTFVKDNYYVEGRSLKTYDTSGNLLGEVNIEEDAGVWSFSLADGVIQVSNAKRYWLYNSALETLF